MHQIVYYFNFLIICFNIRFLSLQKICKNDILRQIFGRFYFLKLWLFHQILSVGKLDIVFFFGARPFYNPSNPCQLACNICFAYAYTFACCAIKALLTPPIPSIAPPTSFLTIFKMGYYPIPAFVSSPGRGKGNQPNTHTAQISYL